MHTRVHPSLTLILLILHTCLTLGGFGGQSLACRCTQAIFGVRDRDHLKLHPDHTNRTFATDGFLVVDPKANIANGNTYSWRGEGNKATRTLKERAALRGRKTKQRQEG